MKKESEEAHTWTQSFKLVLDELRRRYGDDVAAEMRDLFYESYRLYAQSVRIAQYQSEMPRLEGQLRQVEREHGDDCKAARSLRRKIEERKAIIAAAEVKK